MKTIMLLPAVALLCACASTSDSAGDSEPRQRTSGMQVSASAGGDTVDCPSRNSTCYNNVVRACGDRGVEVVDIMGRSRVTTAGRSGSTDDPFARVDATRNPSSKPVSVRCREERSKPGS